MNILTDPILVELPFTELQIGVRKIVAGRTQD
jgi:hypothetical protein